jgi:peptidoglycan/LPS O-acetylase OafA/YrhL
VGKGRIQSLDGLRAVSITAVTVSHFAKHFFPAQANLPLMNLGVAGVDVFFVISGFLITSLMLREHDKYGRISLTGFYRRRCLRIFPAYFFFLLLVFVLSRFALLPINNHAWPYLLTYTYNLNPHLGLASVGQVWSLCVEEHFYLLWPFTVVLLGVRRAPIALYACILAAIALRFWLFLSHSALDIEFFSPTRLDTIAVGCLLAFAFRRPWIQRVRGERLAACAIAVLFTSVFLIHSGKYQLGPAHFIEAAMIAVVIACLVQDASGPMGRFFNWRPVVWIGVLSYSIYLAQTIVYENLFPFALRIPAALLYACFSYYLIESPFLKLKDRTKAPAAKVEQVAAGS